MLVRKFIEENIIHFMTTLILAFVFIYPSIVAVKQAYIIQDLSNHNTRLMREESEKVENIKEKIRDKLYCLNYEKGNVLYRCLNEVREALSEKQR